jgi:hypothetical protein
MMDGANAIATKQIASRMKIVRPGILPIIGIAPPVAAPCTLAVPLPSA